MQLRFEIQEDGSGVFISPNANDKSWFDKLNKLKAEQEAGTRSDRSCLRSLTKLMHEAPDLVDFNLRCASHFYSEGDVEEALAAALCSVKCAHLLMPKGFNGPVEWKHPGNRAYLMAIKHTILSYYDLGQHEAALAQIKLLLLRNPDFDQDSFET